MAENRRKQRRLVSPHVSVISKHVSATAKADNTANVANVIAPRGSSYIEYIELLSPLTDMCTTDVDLPMSTSNLKKRREGPVIENANSVLGLATWRTTAINSRRLNKDRIQRVLQVRIRKVNRHQGSLRGRHPLLNSSPAQPKCAATMSGVSIAMPMSILRLIATASLPIVSSIVQSKLQDGMGLWIPLLVLDLSTLLAKVDADIDCPMSTMLRQPESSC